LSKELEELLKIVLSDTYPSVYYLELDVAILTRHRNSDASREGKLDSVANQVKQDLLYAFLVAE
jgi:hypothetical protein